MIELDIIKTSKNLGVKIVTEAASLRFSLRKKFRPIASVLSALKIAIHPATQVLIGLRIHCSVTSRARLHCPLKGLIVQLIKT
jgi:hypothetical protein